MDATVASVTLQLDGFILSGHSIKIGQLIAALLEKIRLTRDRVAQFLLDHANIRLPGNHATASHSRGYNVRTFPVLMNASDESVCWFWAQTRLNSLSTRCTKADRECKLYNKLRWNCFADIYRYVFVYIIIYLHCDILENTSFNAKKDWHFTHN